MLRALFAHPLSAFEVLLLQQVSTMYKQTNMIIGTVSTVIWTMYQ